MDQIANRLLTVRLELTQSIGCHVGLDHLRQAGAIESDQSSHYLARRAVEPISRFGRSKYVGFYTPANDEAAICEVQERIRATITSEVSGSSQSLLDPSCVIVFSTGP